MAGHAAREGLLVDLGTGVLRRGRVLAQEAPKALLFLGFGARAIGLCRFATGDGGDEDATAPGEPGGKLKTAKRTQFALGQTASDSDPFIAHCGRLAAAAERDRPTKVDGASALLDIEDRSLRRLVLAEWLAKAGYDAEEPRDEDGRWTAEGDGDTPFQVAQEGEAREGEDLADPLAPTRQALWDAGIATLRQIDPGNPALTYVATPDAAPSQAALDRLDAAIEAAAIKRVTDKVMPGGVPIGEAGSGADVRELPGGAAAAREWLNDLGLGGTIYRSASKMTIVKLPGDAGYITFRPVSRSGPPAVDVNVQGVGFLKLHFLEGE